MQGRLRVPAHSFSMSIETFPLKPHEVALHFGRRLETTFASLDSVSLIDMGDHIYLNSVSVKQRFRGRGIGSKVVRIVKQFAANRGLPLVLVCDPNGDQVRLRRFYRRLGFKPTGRTLNTRQFGFHSTGHTLVFAGGRTGCNLAEAA
jgi:ribosomal protein S18 acetylase RimI-like enzyme